MSEPRTPDTGTCGCCAGTAPSTPRIVRNRPGLPEIGYRSGTHGEGPADITAAHQRPPGQYIPSHMPSMARAMNAVASGCSDTTSAATPAGIPRLIAKNTLDAVDLPKLELAQFTPEKLLEKFASHLYASARQRSAT